MLEEAANQENERKRDDDQRRAERDREGYQNPEVELEEISLERLPAQVHVPQANRRVREFHRSGDHEVLASARQSLARGYSKRPRQRVQPGAHMAARQ